MNRIMLDLETMGNGPNAAILSIGAVRFDVDTGIVDAFHNGISLASAMSTGGVADASTIEWWMGQSEEARKGVLARPQGLIEDVLYRFSMWATKDGGVYVDEIWGNGATADNVWLANAYRRLDLEAPWTYKADRCFRTMRAMFQDVEEAEFVGTQHDALDDAKNQALHLIKILKHIKRETPGV